MRRTRAFCAVLLFFSLFHQEWGATHSYDMEPVSDSCKRHFLNLSRHNKSNKTMWGFGFLSAQGLLLTKFDFIVPPWTSCGVEFQAYYTSPTEKQCKKGSPNITQRAVFKIYNSNLEEIHKDTVFINLTTTPQEYSLQWDDISKTNKQTNTFVFVFVYYIHAI